MKKICVLIRVYNRIEDLKYCIDIIRETWHSYQYYILVVSNGREDGYIIDEVTLKKIDCTIEIKNNIGHFTGNSQLLLEGLPKIPKDCDFTVLLEADTWVYGDELIKEYVSKLEVEKAVWASAQFFRYTQNLATDFAIVKTSFVKTNPTVFTFNKTPEYYVANYLIDNGYKFIYIKENMPVNLPRYVKNYPFAPTGRFFVFPLGRMVTHHVESLTRGMDEKKFYFNLVAKKKYFDVPDIYSTYLARIFLKFSIKLTGILPYKGWFINRKNV